MISLESVISWNLNPKDWGGWYQKYCNSSVHHCTIVCRPFIDATRRPRHWSRITPNAKQINPTLPHLDVASFSEKFPLFRRSIPKGWKARPGAEMGEIGVDKRRQKINWTPSGQDYEEDFAATERLRFRGHWCQRVGRVEKAFPVRSPPRVVRLQPFGRTWNAPMGHDVGEKTPPPLNQIVPDGAERESPTNFASTPRTFLIFAYARLRVAGNIESEITFDCPCNGLRLVWNFYDCKWNLIGDGRGTWTT